MKKDLDKGGGVKLGVNFIQSFMENSIDKGISYTFATLNNNDTYIPLADRLSFLYFAYAKSPLKSFYLRQILEIRSKPGDEKARILIIINSPII